MPGTEGVPPQPVPEVQNGITSTEKQKDAEDVVAEMQISETAAKVMSVLGTYFWSANDESGWTKSSHWPGVEMFEKNAKHWIRMDQPVHLVLPAFPFKSANLDKVTGFQPDFAEFLGLSRLNQICLDVRRVYEHGARITLATDGVVFNDLVLVDDTAVWNYGEAIREMVRAHYFHHNIHVVHAMELLGIVSRTELTEDAFYKTSVLCRDRIVAQFTQHEEAMQALVDSDPDSCLTYTGIKTFCKVDQANSIYRTQAASRKAFLRDMSSLALKILARSEGFGKLIRERLPHHIRLSIHPSSGAAKLSICLLPQPPGHVARAPWMSCIAVDERGNYLSVHSKDVRDTHDLVHQAGRPWLFRLRSIFDSVDSGQLSDWRMEHLYPAGLRIWQTGSSPDRHVIPFTGGSLPGHLARKLDQLAAWQPVQVIGG